MKKREIINYVAKIFQKYNINNYKLLFDYKIPSGNGFCSDYYINNKELHIGCKELKSLSNINIPDDIFTKILITTFHEIEHIIQQKEYFSIENMIDENKNKRNMFINYLACIGSKNGYYQPEINPKNYYNNSREISAEYTGIVKAYKELLTCFNKQKSDSLILEYINNKKDKQYFVKIDNSVTNVEDIKYIFNKAIAKSNIIQRYYNPSCINKDLPVKYCQSINDEFVFAINECNNPLQQDKLLAGAFIKYIEDKDISHTIKDSCLYKENKEDLYNLTEYTLINQMKKDKDYEGLDIIL